MTEATIIFCTGIVCTTIMVCFEKWINYQRELNSQQEDDEDSLPSGIGIANIKAKRLLDGEIFEVRKYIKDGNEISVWCNDWYGHHIVGIDCEIISLNKAN